MVWGGPPKGPRACPSQSQGGGPQRPAPPPRSPSPLPPCPFVSSSHSDAEDDLITPHPSVRPPLCPPSSLLPRRPSWEPCEGVSGQDSVFVPLNGRGVGRFPGSHPARFSPSHLLLSGHLWLCVRRAGGPWSGVWRCRTPRAASALWRARAQCACRRGVALLRLPFLSPRPVPP